MTVRFGTDGWRAVISETFTFANLRLVAQAIADFIREEKRYRPECRYRLRHSLPQRPLRGGGGSGDGGKRDSNVAGTRGHTNAGR